MRPQVLAPELIVTSRLEAGRLLTSERSAKAFDALISIGSPGEAEPSGFDRISRSLRLEFDDVTEASTWETVPEQGDVERLIAFARELQGNVRRVLVHCQAGVSRSTAAAFIVWCVWLGPGHEEEARGQVLAVAPWAFPNTRMLELADALLDRKGVMLSWWLRP